MANLPISGLTASASNAAATDVLPVVQTTGTGPVKMTVQQMAGGLLGSTTISGATITADSPVLNLAQTWNAGAVTFTGLKFNATSTASASGSLLMDLQVGSVSAFNVSKGGSIKLGLNTSGTNVAASNVTISAPQGTGTGAGGSITFQVAPAGGSGTAQNVLVDALTIDAGNFVRLRPASTTGSLLTSGDNGFRTLQLLGPTYGSNGVAAIRGDNFVAVRGSGGFAWENGGNNPATGTLDLFLYRDTTNTLALRNGTAAQAFNIYNTYTSSTSFERYSVDWITTANLVIVGPNKGSVGGTQRVQRLSYLEDGGAGSTVPLLGSTCPAVSGTVKSWIKVITSDGTTAYVPCWA